MHILLLPSWYPQHGQDLNGCFFREQAHALRRAGHEVGVLLPQFRSLRDGWQGLRQAWGESYWRDREIPTYFAHGFFTSSKVPHLDRNRWVARGEALYAQYEARHGRPDILHAHSLLLGGLLAHRLSERLHRPFGVTEHSSTFGRGMVASWARPRLRAAAEAAAFRFAVSRALADQIEDCLTAPPWQVLPNMLAPIFAEDRPLLPRAQRLIAPPLALSGRDQPAIWPFASRPERAPFRLLSVAHLTPKKGFDALLSAFAIAVRSDPRLRLAIGGDGPEGPALRRRVEDLGLSPQVEFLGALSRLEVRNQMRKSDAFVLASQVEPFGIVVIEALSQGLPVIATTCGGPEEILTPRDGILVPRAQPEALANAMVQMVRQRAQYAPQDLQNRARMRFSEGQLIHRLEGAYEQACAVPA